MNQDVCLKCIRDFYHRRYDGNPSKEMDPNEYSFYFDDEIGENGYNWLYWYNRGVLHGCIKTVPRNQPIGVESAKILVKKCPHMKEHFGGECLGED